MKGLSVAGTAAMFLVGGGILVHGVPALHHAVEGLGEAVAQGALGGLWRVLAVNVLNAGAGIVAGALVLAGVGRIKRLRPPRGAAKNPRRPPRPPGKPP